MALDNKTRDSIKDMSLDEYVKFKMGMMNKKLDDAYSKLSPSIRNYISNAVSLKKSSDEMGISDVNELIYYNYLWTLSEIEEARYGYWPERELEELGWDEIPDIYPDDFNSKVKESLKKKESN